MSQQTMTRRSALPVEALELDNVPKNIRPNTSNPDMTLFLFKQLLLYDSDFSHSLAWNMVKSFHGNGEGSFALTKEQWIGQFGDILGSMLFHKIKKEKKDLEKDIPTKTPISNFVNNLYISNINNYRQIQSGYFLDILGRFLRLRTPIQHFFEGIKSHKLEITKRLWEVSTRCRRNFLCDRCSI